MAVRWSPRLPHIGTLKKLEKWNDRNLIKLNTEKCKFCISDGLIQFERVLLAVGSLAELKKIVPRCPGGLSTEKEQL